MATATGTTRTAPARRTETLRLPRTTGAVSGLIILLLGIWGGLIPLVGPYFHYAFGGLHTWHFTSQRLWLCIVPGAVAVIGGLMLMSAASRVGGLTAGWVALAAGVWFAIGPTVSLLWHHTHFAIGAPYGGTTRQTLEWLGYFYALGAAIIALAAFAMGRYFSRPRIAEEPVVAASEAPVAERRAAAGPAAAAPVAERPVTRRTAAADAPVERSGTTGADAPVERPATTGATTTGATTTGPATTAPTTSGRPVSSAPPTTGTMAADSPATTRPPRRRGGLLGRLRGS